MSDDDEGDKIAIDMGQVQSIAGGIRDQICDSVFDGDQTMINDYIRKIGDVVRATVSQEILEESERRKHAAALVAAIFHHVYEMVDSLPVILEGTGMVGVFKKESDSIN